MGDNLYTIEVSGWRGLRYMRVYAESEKLAKIRASRLIWPRKGEYIRNVTEERKRA